MAAVAVDYRVQGEGPPLYMVHGSAREDHLGRVDATHRTLFHLRQLRLAWPRSTPGSRATLQPG
ncbi:MAG: hypothetical protein Ct9H300mP14_04720 [Gammaproteobacteria bacterium]|nr:MAG: hypothetical protein Ct9H300mP14_04720 [Gammaproteobacteria bacterium]